MRDGVDLTEGEHLAFSDPGIQVDSKVLQCEPQNDNGPQRLLNRVRCKVPRSQLENSEQVAIVVGKSE